MRRLVVALALGLASPALAEQWQALTGAEIAEALTGRELEYENGARQSFRDGGTTTYGDGTATSDGRWRVEGDSYCSNWPPTDSWSCYELQRDSESGRLRFFGASENMAVGRYPEG